MTTWGTARLAVVLWLVLAGTVWNVIFDRMVVLAGRRYSHDAKVHFRTTGHYLLIDDVMRPEVGRSARVASAYAGALAVAGLVLIAVAARVDRAKPVRPR